MPEPVRTPTRPPAPAARPKTQSRNAVPQVRPVKPPAKPPKRGLAHWIAAAIVAVLGLFQRRPWVVIVSSLTVIYLLLMVALFARPAREVPRQYTARELAAMSLPRIISTPNPEVGFTGLTSESTAAGEGADDSVPEHTLQDDEQVRIPERRVQLSAGTLVWPIEGHVITSPFGERVDPVMGASVYQHKGLDIRAECGTPVVAAMAGEVIGAELTTGSGNVVRLAHPGGMISRYAHLARLDVSTGQKVAAGQQLGLSGASGRTTGPHLHFEVSRNGAPKNPMSFHYKNLPASAFALKDRSVQCESFFSPSLPSMLGGGTESAMMNLNLGGSSDVLSSYQSIVSNY